MPGSPNLTLKDGRPFCAAYPCDQLFPLADRFLFAESLGLPVLEARQGGTLLGYLFLSADLAPIPAYSGKPLVTLIAMDAKGTILGAKVIQHHEPILLVGIPARVLDEYLAQYIGRSILAPSVLEVSRKGEEHEERDHGGREGQERGRHTPPEGSPEAARERLKAVGADEPPPQVYMISGATVTALVLDETLLTTSRAVAQALGLMPADSQREIAWHTEYVPKAWSELAAEGSIGHLRIEAKEMEAEKDEDADSDSNHGEDWLDIYFGDLTQPIIGRNVLGESDYAWLERTLKPGEKAVFVASNGTSSFKGSGFVRGGIFDRFHIRQGMKQFVFHDLDYENLYAIEAQGAPRFKETGLFFVRNTRFDSTLPWQFVYLASRLTGETARSKVFKTFTADYALPAKYYDVKSSVKPAKQSIAARVWRDRWPQALGLALFLSAVMGLFFARTWLRASERRLDSAHVAVLIASVVYVGIVLRTTPSVTQLFPLFQAAREGFHLDLFLSDPLLFVFWVFIAVSLVLWGRGWFCGWVCPYGAFLELTHRVTRRLVPKGWVRQLPRGVHHVLRRVRYGILAVLLLLSFFSIEWAERLAEVEPFKTTWIVGVFNRDWYLILYWWALLAVSAFVFRFFCRYVCPLGAALSIATALRIIGIRRKEFCTRCKICARNCDSLAIDELGRINKYECLYCMECEQKYHDDRVCPPLAIARRKASQLADTAARPAPNPPGGGATTGI